MFFRAFAIAIEVGILMVVIYSIFLAVRLTIVDVGFQPKYDRFVKWALVLVGSLVSAFFVAHLALFYPKLLP
jgi:hypothetical protein